MSRILIVDDEAMIREAIREYALAYGYDVVEAENGVAAIECCQDQDFDVIIMDLMMPGIDGFTAYEKIKKTKDIPVLVLSARGEEYDKLYGFSLGIDDYMVKPFSPKELMARINVIITRNNKSSKDESGSTSDEDPIISFPHLTIHKDQYSVYVDGKKLDNLTRKEYELLTFMAQHPQIVFSRGQLLNNIWGYDYVGDGRTVDTHIKMLRQSLGICRDYIVTARGIGYKFDAGE